jgi:hypothetical protein
VHQLWKCPYHFQGGREARYDKNRPLTGSMHRHCQYHWAMGVDHPSLYFSLADSEVLMDETSPAERSGGRWRKLGDVVHGQLQIAASAISTNQQRFVLHCQPVTVRKTRSTAMYLRHFEFC